MMTYRNMLPTIGILLNQLPPPVKLLTRKLERTEKKLVNCSSGVSFLNVCIQEKMLPKFTDIYIYIYIYIYIGEIKESNLRFEQLNVNLKKKSFNI